MPSSPRRSSSRSSNSRHRSYDVNDEHYRRRRYRSPSSRSRNLSRGSHHSHHRSRDDHHHRYRSRSRSRSRDSLYRRRDRSRSSRSDSPRSRHWHDNYSHRLSPSSYRRTFRNDDRQSRRMFQQRTRRDNRLKSERYTKEEIESCRHIFLGNLDSEVNNDTIKRQIGSELVDKVLNITMFQGGSRPKGIAFVECNSHEDAEEIFNALKGTAIRGRTINVDWDIGREAKEKQRRKQDAEVSLPPLQDSSDFASSSSDPSSLTFSNTSSESADNFEKEEHSAVGRSPSPPRSRSRSRSPSQPHSHSRSQSPRSSAPDVSHSPLLASEPSTEPL
ncbi:uncharacterized protein MONOS_2333 [Monocercomonoides exilis]|uniref:uncharacterized protein n=1 Tax=Monocercomonoides exilis TaxID=2049356 RepID=UPI003559C420|nr:hypothetical protein MONOS_2333 [Monocercomonoides exilis]|eukprot:MONOS_2333.1-p1 / transcript=MONOS_2333.1 / gene=MONOS_2333 / organism=Monocercomonoides_exilis_PA203 / gene_product=unspecified product / transcript_product=unspecified product / location=Mono_scaffold00047:152422-153414(-) / protein_length=330 / sequence_SO=supercontig / SO=protein_coding / is_pseudo=false